MPERPLIVYVAGAARDQARARSAMDAVATLGLELAHDWLSDLQLATSPDDELSDEQRGEYAWTDLTAVARSDVLWLLATEETVGRGAWVELGFAYGLAAAGVKAPIVVVSGGARRCIFTAPHAGLATVELATDLDAIDCLRTCATRRTATNRRDEPWAIEDGDIWADPDRSADPTVPAIRPSKATPSSNSSD